MTTTTTDLTPTEPVPAGLDGQPAVRIRGLVKTYGDLRAVDGIDLDVPQGSVFGLIGPNGAGKTTTMSVLVTLARADGGSVEVFGHDPATDARTVRSLVGFMPDFFGLYEGLTCREYLDFFGTAYHVEPDRRQAQVDGLLELVELTHKANTDVQALSRGMQQRLSLARALVHDPKLLVLDEPASGLDPRARVELREILKELARRGHTILLSSHILSELEQLCDRVGIIEAGKVLAQGTPTEIESGIALGLGVTFRILGDAADRESALATAAAAGVACEVQDDGRLRCEVTGGEQAVADLLAALIGAGVRVVDFREDRQGLEGLFLRVTKGIVR